MSLERAWLPYTHVRIVQRNQQNVTVSDCLLSVSLEITGKEHGAMVWDEKRLGRDCLPLRLVYTAIQLAHGPGDKGCFDRVFMFLLAGFTPCQ